MKNFVKYWIPVYLMAFVIFYFSSLSRLPEPLVIKTPDYIKHFTEYLFFSFLVFRAFNNTNSFKLNHSLFTFIFISLFAISDEIFQAFTPGRISSLFDVSLDSFSFFSLIIIKKLLTST